MSCMMSLGRKYRALASDGNGNGNGNGIKGGVHIIKQRSSVNASQAAFYLKTVGVDVDGKYPGLHLNKTKSLFQTLLVLRRSLAAYVSIAFCYTAALAVRHS